MVDNNKIKQGHTYIQWTFALFANITFLAYGFECGWISPTAKVLQSDTSPTGYPVSNSSLAWIASSMSIAATCGVSIYSFIVDKYGRKMGLICIVVPEAISWIIKLSYVSITSLIIARLCSGLAAGGCFSVVPMYVKEISQDNIRGMLGTLSQLLQSCGILAMYLLGAYFDYYTVIITVMCLPIVTSLIMVKAPESPAFLVKNGKINEAAETIAFLRGLDKANKTVQSILDNIKAEDEHFKSLPSLTIAAIFKNKVWRRAFILIITMFLFHSLNGAFAILTYASIILNTTGVKFEVNPEIQTFIFPIIMIVGSMSLASIVERFGRKILLCLAFLITAISMTVIAALIILQRQGIEMPAWLPVTAMVLAVAMYGAGVAPLPYIIMTETLNFEIRAKVMGIVVTVAWFHSFILISSYAPLVSVFGPEGPFMFYAVINLLGAIHAITFLPETRGKTEKEIYEILLKDMTKTPNITNSSI